MIVRKEAESCFELYTVSSTVHMLPISDITIHRAQKVDFADASRLLEVFRTDEIATDEAHQRLNLITTHPDQSLWIAKSKNQVIGLLGFRIRHNLETATEYGEVSSIVVDERWQKRGVGQLLLDHAEALARQHGCLGLWLVSGFGREEQAHNFYEAAGFGKTGFRFVKLF
ncbi:MAG: GNAT family N-acetyltransferase [Bryobacteraceae bacterium]